MEPPDHLSCLTTPGVGRPGDGLLPVPLTRGIQMHTPSPCGGLPPPALACARWGVHGGGVWVGSRKGRLFKLNVPPATFWVKISFSTGGSQSKRPAPPSHEQSLVQLTGCHRGPSLLLTLPWTSTDGTSSHTPPRAAKHLGQRGLRHYTQALSPKHYPGRHPNKPHPTVTQEAVHTIPRGARDAVMDVQSVPALCCPPPVQFQARSPVLCTPDPPRGCRQ